MRSCVTSPIKSVLAIVFLVPLMAHGQGTLTTLHSFGGPYSFNKLTQGTDGNFYGSSLWGGTNGLSAIFKMTPTGTLNILASLVSDASDLVQGTDDNFYGTTGEGRNGFGGVFKIAAAGSFTIPFAFNGTNGDVYCEDFPLAPLTEGTDGNFYGTTYSGGKSDNGTVFKVTPNGILTTLVLFQGNNGANPSGGLLRASDGNFYGQTIAGGSFGNGTIFKMTPAGSLTTSVSFNGTNGSACASCLTQGSDGNFYGTTSSGGVKNLGTVFQMTPGGVLTTLVDFSGTNGANPVGSLIQGTDGNFYGAAASGGTNGQGTIFRMTPSGELTNMVTFNFENGYNPADGLIQGADDNLYGTTVDSIFRLTTDGRMTTLFSGMGASPLSGLMRGKDGSFYGTTSDTFTDPYEFLGEGGTAFKITPSGNLTTIALFPGTNGGNPSGPFVEDAEGNFYGTTAYGGMNNNGYGTVFKMSQFCRVLIYQLSNPIVHFEREHGRHCHIGGLGGIELRLKRQSGYGTQGGGSFIPSPKESTSSIESFPTISYRFAPLIGCRSGCKDEIVETSLEAARMM